MKILVTMKTSLKECSGKMLE